MLIIDQEAGHTEQFINVPAYRQWYVLVKQFVFFHSPHALLHTHSQACNRLCLSEILSTHLLFVAEKGRPVHLTRSKVVHNKPFVHHDRHTWLQHLYDPRQLEDLVITHRACIQSRHKGNSTVGCHANHGLECSVRFVRRENLTLKEQRGWCLTEYLCTIKDHLCVRKSCKLRWQVSSHCLWRNPKALTSQQQLR